MTSCEGVQRNVHLHLVVSSLTFHASVTVVACARE